MTRYAPGVCLPRNSFTRARAEVSAAPALHSEM